MWWSLGFLGKWLARGRYPSLLVGRFFSRRFTGQRTENPLSRQTWMSGLPDCGQSQTHTFLARQHPPEPWTSAVHVNKSNNSPTCTPRRERASFGLIGKGLWLCVLPFAHCASSWAHLSVPPVAERPAPHPALSHPMGEGEDPLAAGLLAACHPCPLSIGWREGEDGLRGGWWYGQGCVPSNPRPNLSS